MKLTKFTAGLLAALSFLTLISQVEARTIYSAMSFKAIYKNREIYGAVNTWDNRACAYVDGNFLTGTADDRGHVKLSPQKHFNIIDKYILNPYGYNQIPKKWRESNGFKKCSQLVSLAKCFLPADSTYYDESEEKFVAVTKKRIPAYSLGSMTNSYSRGSKPASEGWAYLFLNNNENDDTTYIVDRNLLECPSKLK
jgi:hypothetical protein